MKLYKYMSPHAGYEFFKDGTIRVSQNNSLNDPFEVLLTEHDKSKIMELTKKVIQINNTEYQIHKDISDFLNMSGIISLSKNKESMPMWGNYAADNKGMLVEFEVDDDDPFSMFDCHMMNSDDAYVCGDVIYSKNRSFNKRMYQYSNEEILEISKHYFLTKHESWKHEEEFRFVFPFHNCNKIIALENDSKNKNKLNTLLNKVVIGTGKNDISNFFECGLLTEGLDFWNTIWRNFDLYKVLFLIKIKPKNISAVYLGVNSNVDEFKQSIIEGSKYERGIRTRFYNAVDQNFNDVFKCKLDKDNFKLEYEPLI
ncbi:MAG: DUF2971 domain-containing protein [Flavobacteriales bacterium]|nr:DUF2971 domain-containing protein [Flavobacteriales bacterium]